MLEDDAMLVDHFVREIVGLSRFHLLTHDRGGSVGFAFLGNYLAREDKEYEITYHFISNGGLFLPLTNLGQGQYQRQASQAGRLGHQLGAVPPGRPARPRVTEGTPQQVGNANIQAFNQGIGARFYVGKYLLERAANEYRWLDNLRESPVPRALPCRLSNRVPVSCNGWLGDFPATLTPTRWPAKTWLRLISAVAADRAAVGDGGRSVVERIVQCSQALRRPGRGSC